MRFWQVIRQSPSMMCALACVSLIASCGADGLDDARRLLTDIAADTSQDAPSDTRTATDSSGDTSDTRSQGEDTADVDVSEDTGADAQGDGSDAIDTTPPGDTTADVVDASPDTDATACPSPPGAHCNPIEVDAWPFVDARDTTAAPEATFDAYSCAPQTDESGGEFVYRIEVAEGGLLRASLDDVGGDGVDVDVQLLGDLDSQDCLTRGNVSLSATLDPGVYHVVVDTWVNGSGVALSGAYELTLEWTPMPTGDCAMETQDLRMFWSSCDPSLDCYEANGDVFLRTPASGPVVKEAHLVTTLDDFGGGWPQSFTDGIDAHYAMSEGVSGYALARGEPWAPAGEGGSEYGQGSTGAPLPPDAEAWYVNMHWRDRPAKGTRMIVINPETGQAVVAAAGYETGPGSNTAIGGAVEELHLYLGTGHRESLLMGFAVDQSLPFGPINCGP